MHIYEIRPRKDHRGFDLISDALPLVGCGSCKCVMQSATPNFTVAHMLL